MKHWTNNIAVWIVGRVEPPQGGGGGSYNGHDDREQQSMGVDRGWMGLGFGEKRVRRRRCGYPCYMSSSQVRSLVLFESTLYVFLGFVSYHKF